MEEVVKQAQNALGMYGRKTILFIDPKLFYKSRESRRCNNNDEDEPSVIRT